MSVRDCPSGKQYTPDNGAQNPHETGDVDGHDNPDSVVNQNCNGNLNHCGGSQVPDCSGPGCQGDGNHQQCNGSCEGSQSSAGCVRCQMACKLNCQGGAAEPPPPEENCSCSNEGGQCHCSNQGGQCTCSNQNNQCYPTNMRPDDWHWTQCVLAGQKPAAPVRIVVDRTQLNRKFYSGSSPNPWDPQNELNPSSLTGDKKSIYEVFEAIGKEYTSKDHFSAVVPFITAAEWNSFIDRINEFEVYHNRSYGAKTHFERMEADGLMKASEAKKAYEAIVRIQGSLNMFDHTPHKYTQKNGTPFPKQKNNQFNTPEKGKVVEGFTFQDLQIMLNNVK